jgi:hypothetical protein
VLKDLGQLEPARDTQKADPTSSNENSEHSTPRKGREKS